MYYTYIYIFGTLSRRCYIGHVPPITSSSRIIYLSVCLTTAYTYIRWHNSGLSRTRDDHVVVGRPQDDCWSNYRTNRRSTKDSSDSGKTGNLIPKSATKDDRATELTNSTKDSSSDSTPRLSCAFPSLFFLPFLLLNVFRTVTGWKTRFVDSREVREDRRRLRLLDLVNYGLMEAKVPPINELAERQRERSGTLWSKD